MTLVDLSLSLDARQTELAAGIAKLEADLETMKAQEGYIRTALEAIKQLQGIKNDLPLVDEWLENKKAER